MKQEPVCHVIAGPNGAGKTTFAMRHLPRLAGCENFINADMIAQGLSPLNPGKSQITAGKVFLREIELNRARQVDFAFETTLSGRSHVNLIKKLRKNRWRVILYFLWIPDAGFSRDRVLERVEHGGHDIPTDAIFRRYRRIMRNLFTLYIPLCDEVFFYDNSNSAPAIIFEQSGTERSIINETVYAEIMEAHQ